MFKHGCSKIRVIRHPGFVQSGHVKFHKTETLFFANSQATVNIDQMTKSKVMREQVWTAERLRRKGGEMIDMLWFALAEKRDQQRVSQYTGVEYSLQLVQRFLSACEFIERGHEETVHYIIRAGNQIPPPHDQSANHASIALNWLRYL